MSGDERARKMARFFYEAGQLRRVARSGWWMAGVRHPESVAEHSFRAALMARMLAPLEGADPCRAVTLALFHDLPEARTQDMHKVSQLYVDHEKSQAMAAEHQAATLPDPESAEAAAWFSELRAAETPEARVAHDADLLECLFTAREYQERGLPTADWVTNCRNRLSTPTARAIADAAMSMPPADWWKELKSAIVKEQED
ncbi:MAG: HD domain-containing protein [Deltaproteobacteria bacterium]|nr:HD domain-containing protein [Deltaproteobacteria bacterium]